ncbi:MAG: Ig-like domain-containing protein [Myxococcales bacterium]|nr:Ig-like domain-containing protein [Myxococcales bacterium]
MVPLVLALIGAATTIAAEPSDTLFGQPRTIAPPLDEATIEARREAFDAAIDELGWVRAGDMIAPAERFAAEPPPGFPALEAGWEDPPHRTTIYLNFLGGELKHGTNASENQSNCIMGTVQYPAYVGTEAKALAAIQVFETKLAPYGVRVAWEKRPPKELPYSMVMMGGKPQDIGMGAGTLGVSCSSDCGDQWWRDTTLAFTGAASQATTIAYTALQEAAHAMGLDHIDGSANIMYPYATSGDKVWANGCTKFNDATGPIGCTYVHKVFCPDEMSQDDHAELTAFFGPNSPDEEAPIVNITEPADGAELASGETIVVKADITDNFEGAGWKIMVYQDGNLLADNPAYKFEKAWTLSSLPDGVYLIKISAVDHDLNTAEDQVTVYLGQSGPDTGAGTGGTGGTDSGAGTGGTDSGVATGGVTATATDSATGGMMTEEEGCACAVDTRPLPLGLGLLVLMALGRRRRD